MRDVPTAKAAVAELQKCVDRTTQAQETYWMEQLAIQTLGASAWLDLAEGRTADALAAMRAAADREDRTEKAGNPLRGRSLPRANCSATCSSS
jgi:hypothetical protein